MGEKFGILRLLRIYHSTSRVKGLGFDLILNLGAGSENHCVQKKMDRSSALFPQVMMGPRACPLAFYVQREVYEARLWDPKLFMSRGRGAEALQVACCPFLSAESPALGSLRAAGSPLYTLPC